MIMTEQKTRVPLFLLFSFLILSPVHIQSGLLNEVVQEKVDLDIVAKIRDEGLNRSETSENAHYLMDVIGPRLTGSTAMKRANEWTAQKMREYGLENVRLEPWEFGRGWEEVSYYGRMTKPFIRPISGRSLAWCGSTDGLQRGPALIVESKSLENLAKYEGKLRGKWILWSKAGIPRDPDFEPRPLRYTWEELSAPPPPLEKREQALSSEEKHRQNIERFERRLELLKKVGERGALGILARSAHMDGIISGESIYGSTVGPLLKPGEPEILPFLVLADEDYSMIYRNVANEVPVTLEFDIKNRFLEDDLMAYNTIGEILGTDKRDEVVIVGAHLDSWHMGTGATDNGACSIIILEAMRILKAINAQPRRTIRIALWSSEEPELPGYGLLGSKAYLRTHEDELNKISIYLNLDDGTGRIRGILSRGAYSQMSLYGIGILEQILFPLRDLGVMGVWQRQGGGDAEAFEKVGVPAFNFFMDPIEYFTKTFHSNVDTYDALILDDLKQAAVVVASTVYHLAIRDQMFPREPSVEGSNAGAFPNFLKIK